MTLTLTTPATVLPVSVEETAAQLRLTSAAEKTALMAVLPVAVDQVRVELDRALVNETWTLTLDKFPCAYGGPIVLPKAPLSSVTSITYKDEAGATQTWASTNYIVSKSTSATAGPGSISLAYDCDYPSTYPVADAITVTFVAGYGATAASVPAALKLAVMLKAGELYDNSENPMLDQLLAPFKTWGIA